MSEPAAHDEAPGRIEWLELFFDLVAVAAVAVLSEGLLEDQTWGGLGLFLVTYGAVWFAWVSVVMYADVAGELTNVRTVVVSMFLLAVMAAASPGHAGHRANAFAVAFLLVRLFAARGALRTGRLMTAWPLLQFGSFTIPWIVSLWVAVPGKYVLWGAAVLFELGLVMVRGEQVAQRALVHFHQRVERHLKAGADRDHGTRGEREMPEFREVGVDAEHLDERLGLFVIIVLGEAVATLVLTAAQSPWDREFVSTVLASFALLVLLWLLTFSYGFASAPGVRLGELAPRIGLPLHLLSTTGILFIGVGISEAASTGENLHGLILWVACGGLTLHALSSLVAGLIGGTGRFWLLSCALPTMVFPLLVAAVAASLEDGMPNQWLIWLLAVPVGWQFAYAQRHSALLSIGRLAKNPS
ncbi:MAG TPA: low temperature requirement protein A [Nocardioides sp.]|jgi:low temperature requirement protein LtrA|nr:low temperature requirement protein A [Nocardioides sp.]